MNFSFVSVVFLVSLVDLSSAYRRWGRQEGPVVNRNEPPAVGSQTQPSGIPGGKRCASPFALNMFPACDLLVEALKEKHEEMSRSKLIGPESNCKKDRRECIRKDMHTVRCAVADQPSQECIKVVMNYIQGSACDPKEGGTIITEDDWDTVDEPK